MIALPIAEQAAPVWLAPLLLLVPVTIMLVAFRASIRWHIRARAARRALAGRRTADQTELGSATAIADPSEYAPGGLLKALAIRPEHDGPTPEDLPFDEGWYATGLKSKTDGGTNLEPQVLWGTRAAGQVFIRVGPDERIERGQPWTNRHFRQITVLRVAAPKFLISALDGVLEASDETPPPVRGLLSSLSADPVTWSNTHVAGGPEGIVASRGSVDPVGMSWIYDVWLVERIAAVLRLAPLDPVKLSPAWKVPYRLGKFLTPKVGSGR